MATTVKITGSGNSSNCYVTIGGTKYTAAANTTVNAGDTITFLVKGRSSSYAGKVTIDGAEVLKVTSNTTSTYDWVVPAGLKSIDIALAYSSSFYTYGTITVTTKAAPKTHRTLVDAAGYGISKGWCLVDATKYGLQKGRTLVDGTGYDLNFESDALYLELLEWGNADRVTTVSETEIYMSVISTDMNYAGTEFQLYQQGEPYLLPKGSVVSATFVGSGGSAKETRIRFCTDINNSSGTQLEKLTSSGTYTVTTPCYMTFLCQTANKTNGPATLSITDLTIDGVRAWAK